VFDFWDRDSVIYEAEEAIGCSGVHELGGDLVDAGGEIMEGDLGDGAVGVLGWCHFEIVRL